MDFPSPYFLQTSQWANFWLKANQENHEIHQINCQLEIKKQNVDLTAFIYQYPWHLGQNFLYVPKGPFLRLPEGLHPSKEQVLQLLISFFEQVRALATTLSSAFVKIDFDDNLIAYLGLRDNDHLQQYLQAKFSYKFNFNGKQLQYLQTPVLDCNELINPGPGPDFESLKYFLESNPDFWSQVGRSNHRNTKRSLEENWLLNTQKDKANFKAFWSLIQETSTRQGFQTHPAKYYQELFKQNFSQLIILRDFDNKPQAAWFGVLIGDVLVNLYGGSTLLARKHYAQYLLHLAALQLAVQEKVQFYDLGGYEVGKSYSQFKQSYKGQLRTFLGPVDIITRPLVYTPISATVQLAKEVQNFAKRLAKGQLEITNWVFKFAVGLIVTTSLPLWFFSLSAYWPGQQTQPTEDFEVAIVFGAAINYENLRPSLVLQKRLDKAVELYKNGQVKTILVSGDNRLPDYNEPLVMKKYLIENGVEAVSVVEDFGGRRTLDTCWRARNVFKAEKVYLVSQRFHLPRADFSCRQVGLETKMAPAEDSAFETTFWGVIREVPASWLALEQSFGNYTPPIVSDGTEVNVEQYSGS